MNPRLLLFISNVISFVVTAIAVVKWKNHTNPTTMRSRRTLPLLQEEDDAFDGCCGCNLDGTSGALVTDDCQFQNDYSYAIDILLSCGSERFNAPLRLHTFKRHSRSHERIFNDQLVTFRDSHLWFDAYNTNRCIVVNNDNNELELSSSNSCTSFQFVVVSGGNNNKYTIRTTDRGRCLGLGNSQDCNDDRSTGGEECNGVDHRFLPLTADNDCDDALEFFFSSQAHDCANGATENPSNKCF